MRMIEYYRLNKSVVANLFAKIGSVMVFLISLIYLFTSLPIDSIETFISILFVSVVLGNFIALNILVLVFQIEYVSFKTQNEFFRTLKIGWISEFDCRISFFILPLNIPSFNLKFCLSTTRYCFLWFTKNLKNKSG
jgi:hypothetical protein